jgi:uncharacterized protein YoxC
MMEMSDALQVAMFVACASLTVLVACVLPIVFQARRRLRRLLLAVEQFKAELDPLVGETRELVQSVHNLGKQANRQLGDLHNVVRTVGNWAERADDLVNEVGSAIEPPVLTAVRNISIVRAGMNGFMRVLFHGNNSN